MDSRYSLFLSIYISVLDPYLIIFLINLNMAIHVNLKLIILFLINE
jgi:hypothetical protein